jgi:hypothetical protein
MRKLFGSLTLVLSFATLTAQQIGTPAYVNSPSYEQRGPSNPSPANGNDTLNMTYSNTACGLNYSLSSVRLGQRFVPIGVAQPAPLSVTAVPSCGTVLKAYLYTEALGVAPGITATLTNPANQSSSFPMTLIGSSMDVCWGMNGTHMWRADVTSAITGSGTYTISGLPVSAQSANGVDVEGASLLIIYQDPTASYTGTIQIDDGCHTVAGGALTHTMTGFNACANSTSGSAFMLVGDMQMVGYTIQMNGNNVPQPQWNWWNEITTSTSVTAGQNSCSYSLSTGGDCYTLGVAGLYFQTNCNSCTPTSNSLTVTASGSSASCANNGSATATATGGNGNYSYTWIPGNMTGASVNNLAPGTYTIQVTDGSNCGTGTVTIQNTGMNITSTTAPSNCQGNGSASVAVTGGSQPYTFSWAPIGGSASTATNLPAGTYTCTVTDQTGCSVPTVVTVGSTSPVAITLYMTNDSCPSPTGTGYVSIQGGQGPYSILWSNSATTNYITQLSAGTYTVTVTDANGCTATGTGVVGSAPANFSHYTNMYEIVGACGDSASLLAYSSDPSSTFSWTPSALVVNPNSSNTYAYPTTNMTFYVTITGQCGTAIDSVVVFVDSSNYMQEQICFVTTDTSVNKNVVIWERFNSQAAAAYNIYRETSVSGVYTQIASQPASQFSTYIDNTSVPQQQVYRYMITTVDSCGMESDTTFHHSSIHLQVSASFFGGWNLNWNAYEGLPIQTYNIYRGSSISTMTLLTQVSGSTFAYTDLTPPPGNLWYMIEAVHPFGGCAPSRLNGSDRRVEVDYNAIHSNLEPTNGVTVEENAMLQSSMTLSPNPGNGNFTLQFISIAGTDANITITDALGRVVYSSQQSGTGNVLRVDMNLASLATGVYNVHVNSGNANAVKQLVITE